jgi:hypothetical protein
MDRRTFLGTGAAAVTGLLFDWRAPLAQTAKPTQGATVETTAAAHEIAAC